MTDETASPTRLETGIPGLDRVLKGGLFRRSVYTVEGPTGAGKTVLGNQICHYHAGLGAQAVYLTLLSESHARMIAQLRNFGFFRAELVAKNVHYVSGLKVLEAEGLPGLLRVVREIVTTYKLTVLVMDGLLAVEQLAPTPHEYRKFLHELQALTAMTASTILLLVSKEASEDLVENTIVDGVFALTDEVHLLRPLRHLVVKKFRGAGPVRGRHTLNIGPEGISIWPRVEAQLLRLPEDARLQAGSARVAFGVRELDDMLCGGLPGCSTTMLYGPTGCGKTLLCMQFLAAGVPLGERGLFFGFYERPHELLHKSQRLGLGLDTAQGRELVQLSWHAFGEASIDVVVERLLELIREHHPTRLCIDGIQGFQQAVDFPERLRAVLSALVDALENEHVTTLYTAESIELLDPAERAPMPGISAVTHNMIVLRHVEAEQGLKKLVRVLKLRDSGFDPGLRELRITDTGLSVVSAAPVALVAPHAPEQPGAGVRAATARQPSRAASARALNPPATDTTPRPYILILDDEFGLAELLAELLEEKGYETEIAINGELGLALMRDRRPDLALIDLMMPVLSGAELLRQMKADPQLSSISVVVMTALPEAVGEAPPGTYDAVLQKPFTPERLFEVVRAGVRGPSGAT
jgi:circadian clock protein KaiC